MTINMTPNSMTFPANRRQRATDFTRITGSALSFCFNNDVQYAKTPGDDDLVGQTHLIKVFRRSVGSFPFPFVVVVVIWRLSVPHVDRIAVMISN